MEKERTRRKRENGGKKEMERAGKRGNVGPTTNNTVSP